MDVPEVDRPIQRLVPVQTSEAVHTAHAVHTVHPIHASEFGSERQVGRHGRPEVSLILHGRKGGLGNKGLGCGSLSSLCSGLLRFGDIGASILSVVDALPGPGGLCRESVDDLHSQG